MSLPSPSSVGLGGQRTVSGLTYRVVAGTNGTLVWDAVTTGTHGRRIAALEELLVNPAFYGAVGDGVADDTAALQAAYDSLTVGESLLLNKNYKITDTCFITDKTRVKITGWGIGRIFMENAASNTNAFKIRGTVTGITIEELTVVGEGNPAYNQSCIGSDSGQTINEFSYHHLSISGTNIGISMSQTSSGTYNKGTVYSNTLKNIVGTTSGRGYGIHLDEAKNVHVYQNTLDNCSRHSIYQAKGQDCNNIIEGNIILNHRKDVADLTFRCAISCARSTGISIINNKFYNGYDGAIEIAHDTVNSIDCNGILVANNTFKDKKNIVPYILIGQQTPRNTAHTSRITIKGNTFREDVAVSGGGTTISILHGHNITIQANDFYRENTTTSSNCVTLGDDSFALTDADIYNITIVNNVAHNEAAVSGSRFALVATQLCTGSSAYTIKNNTLTNFEKEVDFLTTPTNLNSKLKFIAQVTYDVPNVPAQDVHRNEISLVGVKPTSSVTGSLTHSVASNKLMHAYHASDTINRIGIQVANVTSTGINQNSQTFDIHIEDF